MLVAILTDVHGNREALSACLAHAGALGADRLIFLGDYVGYGADPVWVLDTVMALVERGAVALLGNHDAAIAGPDDDMNSVAREAIRWTRAQLGPAHRSFLSNLPLTREEGGVLYVHANGYAPSAWDYIVSPSEAAKSIRETDARLTFCGHVHVPMLYHMSVTGKVVRFSPSADTEIPLLSSRSWLAVIGSVGQPRDGNPAAAYALYETDRRLLRFVRVPYDAGTAAQKVRHAGLPEKLALRLEQGF